MKTLFTSFALLICILSNAQNFVWAQSFGGPANDIGKIVRIDNSGNIITAGTFNGTADFDPGPGTYTMTSAGFEDVYITKLNSTGALVWALRFGNATGSSPGTGDNVRGLTTDASGNIYAIGNFSSTVDFNPGGGVNTFTSSGIYDAYILKLNSSGTYVWAKTISGTSNEIGFGIDVDATGVYATGYSGAGADFDPSATTHTVTNAGGSDVFVAKYDLNGNYLWAQGMGGTNAEIGYSIKAHPNGYVYTTGYFGGTADFSPGTTGPPSITSAGNSDIFISVLNASTGSYSLQASMGGTGNDMGIDLAIDGSGNIYTTGSFNGSCDFDPGAAPGFLTSLGSSDPFVCKLTPALTYLWAKQIEGSAADEGLGISIDALGNSYTTGYFNTTADFDPTVSTYTLSGTGQNAFVWKLNSAGNLVWAKNWGSSSSVQGNSIALDSYANVYTTGYYNSTCDFDPNSTTYTITTAGSLDAFVSKLSCTLPQTVTTTAPSSLSLCIGTSTSIPIAMSSAPEANVTYSWSAIGASGIVLSLTSGTTTTASFTASSSFSIVVTGSNTCGTTSTTVSDITINPLPIITTTVSPASGIVCTGKTATITAGGASTYTWNPFFVNGTSQTHTSSQVYTVIATDVNGCVNTNTAAITVVNNPTVNVTGKNLVCLNKPNILTANGALTYTWQPGAVVNSTINAQPGANTTYTVTGKDGNGCTNVKTFALSLVTPVTPSICVVTVDSASLFNYIVWDKTLYDNVDSFIVYREVSTNTYKRIGSTHQSALGQLIDTARAIGPANGDPNITSYRYKIQLRDTCGNYSAMSPYHNSIYFISNTTGTYFWNTYDVEGQVNTPVATFNLLRDNNAIGTWSVIGSASGTQTSLTDPNYSLYPNGAWRVEATGFNCTATFFKTAATTQQVLNKSKSNVKNNFNIPLGIKNVNLNEDVIIAPNPASLYITINFRNEIKQKTEITMTDIVGKVISTKEANEGSQIIIPVSELTKGVYFIRIKQNNSFMIKKFVKD